MAETSSIGKRIRDRRVELGYTVDMLADKLGKNRATIYRYESDAIENFPVSVIAPLADALKTTPGYLMGWDDKKEPTADDSDGRGEIVSVFSDLNSDNRSKLLELSHLFLDAQRKTAEKE